MTNLRVLSLFARHGTARYADALPDLLGIFSRQLPDVVHQVLVADNALPPGHVEHGGADVTVIGCSNAAWEFSAWDAGVAHLGARAGDYDCISLVTSAFRQLDARHLDHLDSAMLARLRGRAAALGHIDCYNAPVSLLGMESQSWLRSSFIIMSPDEVARLGALTSVTDRGAFFSGDPRAPFRDDAPISQGYRRNILGWLTGEGTGQGVEWHSRFRLDATTLARFESKTMAILNEQMLTNRLRAQGCATVDMTWLAAQGRLLPDVVPEWRAQLAGRGTH
jgi:hypothetical protein